MIHAMTPIEYKLWVIVSRINPIEGSLKKIPPATMGMMINIAPSTAIKNMGLALRMMRGV